MQCTSYITYSILPIYPKKGDAFYSRIRFCTQFQTHENIYYMNFVSQRHKDSARS